MHKLSYVQRTIHDAHFNGATKEAERLVVPYGLSGAQRLNIYRNNTFITLTDALSKTFPVINKLVGDDFFAHTASRFIEKHPPKPGPLFEYGDEFPTFLYDFKATSSLPYLSDVARLEWALNVAYHATDETILQIAELVDIPDTELTKLRFDVHPSCFLVTSEYPIDKIWCANQENGDSVQINLDQGIDLLIIRPIETVEFHVISPITNNFLKSMKDGCNVEHAYLRAKAFDPEFNAAGVLIELLSLGVFTAIHSDSNIQI